MIPMPITQTRGKSSGWATRCTWRKSVDPKQPAKTKGDPTESFITEILTTEAAQDEMAGLAQALKSEQERLGIEPQAMYVDAGYVTETTLAQAEQDRKSTRLNSSHLGISYAVFCLKKKRE